MRPAFKSLMVLVFLAAVVPAPVVSQNPPAETVVIDAKAPVHAFPHFWEQMFGSGRAVLSLRESYRSDMRAVKKITGFQYVRFHAILHDEIGVYDENRQGAPVYNFSYVDQVYDGLLQNGVRPFVELSFMPRKLSVDPPTVHPFWYRPLVSPPKDWQRWDDLITAFARHLVDRYGADEVAQWYFEVWNEPNIDFWAGQPKFETYLQLYDHTARALRAVNPRLRVGGPSTAQAAWADVFLKHVSEQKVPFDFVSTHVYGNDRSQDVFGTNEDIPRDKMVCRAVRKVHDQIAASAFPHAPLIWSEFNASYKNEPDVTDSIYMGPWMAETISQCDGLVDIMSYWTFSDVFEEQGVVKEPFYGGFGLIAERDIPKASFNVFRLLHELGDERIAVQSDSVLATRRKDGTLVLALWNYAPPSQSVPAKTFTLRLSGISPNASATISRVDATHGDPMSAYERMGKPASPTKQQIEQLQAAAELPQPEKKRLQGGSITLEVPSQGLVLLEIR